MTDFTPHPVLITEDSSLLTPSQRNAIATLKISILKHDGLDSPDYEYKTFELHAPSRGRYVILTTTVGRKGDEGTLAEGLCRRSRIITIGPRGGLLLLNPAKGVKNPHGWRVSWIATL